MRTIELTLHVPDDLHELVIAALTDLDFSGFMNEDDLLKAYIPLSQWDDSSREQVEALLARIGCPPDIAELVYEPQNWNAQWEETIQPIRVGRFYIKPTWADDESVPDDCVLLEIDPKLSFGTGYHESTRLALSLLPGYVTASARVLDVGTGTGILAIAALKLGAARAICCDTDEWAQQNCVENFYLNAVQDGAEFRRGSLEAVPEAGFELILANIQRNVLLEMMSGFAARVSPGGHVILAGLLHVDRDIMLSAAHAEGFILVQEAVENDWWSVVLRRG